MKRGLILILLLALSSLPFIQAASTTQTGLNVLGCTYLEKTIKAGSCSRDGKYYCSVDSSSRKAVLKNTLIDGGACLGAGVDTCCPFGYSCKENQTTGEYTCELRTTPCSTYTSPTECQDNKCSWFDSGSSQKCIDRPLDYSCSTYQTQETCKEDLWNLGREGLGTDICETYFTFNNEGYVIPMSTCRCTWDTDHCSLSYTPKSEIYLTTPDSFDCLKEFSSGICVEGEQKVSWTATSKNKKEAFATITHENLPHNAKCYNDKITRKCGEPVLKLPGVSPFSLISSILLIGLFYVIRKEK